MRKRTISICALAVLALATMALAQDHEIKSVIGNVFLQNTTPGAAQIGHATITGTFRAGQVFVQQSSTSTIPVVGNSIAASGNAVGGSFSAASTSGTAVRGTATSSTGETTGVLGESRGDGFGVLGRCTIGSGVRGVSTIGTGAFGSSQSGAGLLGISESGDGVRGDTTTALGLGVHARNFATTGAAIAGLFQSDSTSGTGVFGVVSKTDGFGIGVVGETKSTVGGAGVRGFGPNTGAAFGVHGKSISANGFGVFCEGNQAATGTKSFIIDHPLDPENRYLKHYCAEGPEPRNTYIGHVRTDSQGFAWVTLPDYYETINVSPEYLLTVIDEGDDFVLAKVTRKVANGRFQIRTSKPYIEVSWRIDAIRNDRWVRAQGFAAEPSKPGAFRGTYLNPELYNQPSWKGQTKPVEETVTVSRP